MPPENQEAFTYFYTVVLNCKTFATATTAAGIGIVEIKPFAIQPVTEF